MIGSGAHTATALPYSSRRQELFFGSLYADLFDCERGRGGRGREDANLDKTTSLMTWPVSNSVWWVVGSVQGTSDVPKWRSGVPMSHLPPTYPWVSLVWDLKEVLPVYEHHLIACLIANNAAGSLFHTFCIWRRSWVLSTVFMLLLYGGILNCFLLCFKVI